MTLTVRQFPCLSDNYGFLIRDDASGRTACIDTPEAAAILRELEAAGWGLDFILNTHWHPDHAGGNAEIGLRRQAAPEGELFKVRLAGGDTSAHGTITMTVRLPGGAIPGRYDLSVTVIDSSGRRSNPLIGEFSVLE